MIQFCLVEAEGCQVFPSCPALATGGPPPSYEELRSIKVPLEQVRQVAHAAHCAQKLNKWATTFIRGAQKH